MKKQLLILGMLCTILLVFTGCSVGSSNYRSGRKYFKNGYYEEAAERFSKAIELNPNHADYYIDYGMTLITLGQYEPAMEQFDQVYMDKHIRLLQKNNQKALRGKGIAYYYTKQYEKAIQQFDAALNIGVLSELNLDILYYKGNALLMGGAYEEAVEIYTNIIEKYGKTEVALKKRAYALNKIGDFERSLEDYDLAISLEPDRYETYLGKYMLLIDMGDRTGAADVLAQASEIEAVSKKDQYNMAKIHFYQGSYDMALAEFGEGYANGFYEAYYYIGEIYNKKKDFSTAIYYYEKFIEEGNGGMNGWDHITLPGAPAVYHQIAICHMRQGNYNQALKYLEQGIALGHVDTLQALKKNEIIAYEHMGRFDTALEKLIGYMEAYPEDEEARRELQFLKTRQPE